MSINPLAGREDYTLLAVPCQLASLRSRLTASTTRSVANTISPAPLNRPSPKRRLLRAASSLKPSASSTWLGPRSVEVQAAPLLTARLPIAISNASPSTLLNDTLRFAGNRSGVSSSYRKSRRGRKAERRQVDRRSSPTIDPAERRGAAFRSASHRDTNSARRQNRRSPAH